MFVANKKTLLLIASLFLIGTVSAEGYIVEFNHSALTQSNGPASLAEQRIDTQHKDFRQMMDEKGLEVRIENRFKQAFNGVSIEARSGDSIERIEDIPYVRNVQRERNYSVQLADSVPLVGADEVWKKQISGTNITGEGVRVAVLDTGVAYNHSDLGNCSTQEFLGDTCNKVVNGYDFHNDDEDPMDTGGHGTHVAGTIAANGTVEGVAPGAEISAYKVLGENSGTTGDIIAGIEHAVANGSDIISMSLGGSGNPDDSMSKAVDNAVENGTSVVVAAGNSYDYETIGSPGTALGALTVGATNYNDGIASFSSRGPVTYNETIFTKPEITAPGVSICAPTITDSASCKSGYYGEKSGTSMATPHVSGAAALLLQEEPGASPLEIKSRLMLSADDIGYDAFTQGSGRLNVSRAIETDFYTEPSAISLENTTKKSFDRSMTLYNDMGSDLTVELNGTGASMYGGNEEVAVFSDRIVTISNSSSKTINIDFDVSGLKGYYRGHINITANESGYLVPYSFGRHSDHYFTSLNYSDLVSRAPHRANFSISESEYNTSVILYTETGSQTVWENSSNTTGYVDLPIENGYNLYNISVTRHNQSGFGVNRSFEVRADLEAPKLNVSLYPEILDRPGESVTLEANFSDNLGLDDLYGIENSSGSWQVFEETNVYGAQTTCMDQWGDCSIPPKDENNTYDDCSPGDSDYETVNSLEVNATGGPGEPVMINMTTGNTYSSYWQIAVNSSDGWEILASNESVVAANTTFVPQKEGTYTVRGSSSYGSISGYCADDSSFHDNDDVRVDVYKGADYRTDYSDTEGGKSWAGFKLEDEVNNSVNKTYSFKVNEAPRLNVSLNETRYEGGSTAFLNYSAEDPEGESIQVFLNYTGPDQNVSRELSDGNASIDLEESFGQANLSVSAVDARHARNFSNSSFYLKENKSPAAHLEEPFYREFNVGTEVSTLYSSKDNFRVSNVSLYTNQSGEWKRNTTVKDGSFQFTNRSYEGVMKYGIRATDFFGNSEGVNATIEFRKLNTSRSLEVKSGNIRELINPYKVEINRSGWSFAPVISTWPTEEAQIMNESFEDNTSYRNDSFTYSGDAVEGEKSLKGQNGAWIEYNITVDRKVMVTFDRKSVEQSLFKIDDTYPKTLYDTRGNWFQTDKIMEPGQHTLRWEAGGDAELYIDNLTIHDYRDLRRFSWTPEKIGNYTFSFENTETGEVVNKTYYANTSQVTIDVEKGVVPANHTQNITLEPDITEFGNLNMSIGSEKGRVSSTYVNRTEKKDLTTDEPYNQSKIVATVENLSLGIQQLGVNLTAVNDINYSSEGEIIVVPPLNTTFTVEDTDQNPVKTEFGYGTSDELIERFDLEGGERRIMSNITQYSNYSALVESNNSERFYRIFYLDFPRMDEDQNIVMDTFTGVTDGDYEMDLVAYTDYSEASADVLFFGDKTGTLGSQNVYTCDSFEPSSRSCETSWNQADSSITQQNGMNITDVPGDVVAFGKKQEPDDPTDEGGTDDSDDTGFTPTPSPPEPELNVSSEGDGIKIEHLDVDGSREVEVPHGVIESMNFTGDAQEAEVNLREAPRPDMEGKEVYTAVEINTSEDIGARIEFTIEKEWFRMRQVDPMNVSLYRYTESWEELPTEKEENMTDAVRYSAETPGFSTFAVTGDENSGCETGNFPVVEKDSCEVYTNRCNIPDGGIEVESCDIWEEEKEAEKVVDQVSDEVETDQAENKVQEAVEALERDEYDTAIQKATEARNVEQEAQSSGILYIILFIIVIGLLAGSLMAYRYYSRKQTIRKLEELSELVRLEIKKGGVDNRRKVLSLLEHAEEDVEKGNYDKASDRLDEITRHL